jgi:acetoin utilization deacetylase AcuC-like enzyme
MNTTTTTATTPNGTIAKIAVYFRPEATAASRFFAPGTFKPSACVVDWLTHGLPIEVRSHAPASREQLCLAHDPDYVDGVLACRISNGFGGRQGDVAASLPYTTGAMLAAAEHALATGGVACAPVSGFHHAGWNRGGGYCTFNGLIVTARELHRQGRVQRVGILDLDQHYGDGTEEIRRHLRLDWLQHDTAGARPRRAADADEYLDDLPRRVAAFADGDLLLYQAGADPHVHDPLGGWMTDAQLARRDRIVFETAAQMGLPVAWNLAGGYRRDARGSIAPVLAVHRRTMQACAEVHAGTAV